jgi:transcriptional regulator with XRE-family HTH domain
MATQGQIRSAADFGFQLRAERERRGLTQVELASISGVSPRWLSNFERGKAPRAEITKVVHVARALGLVFTITVDQPRVLEPQAQAFMDAFETSIQPIQKTVQLQAALEEMEHGRYGVPPMETEEMRSIRPEAAPLQPAPLMEEG